MNVAELRDKLIKEYIMKCGHLTAFAGAYAALEYIPLESVDCDMNTVLRSSLLKCIYEGPEVNCFSLLRMGRQPFGELCHILFARGPCTRIQTRVGEGICRTISIHYSTQQEVS
ncbi:hypothetical protein KSP39_PZI013558 [Platanthera zijinensis]|uniref:Uncharacterized protein n=1 Tax=Platanthera zijinensis TaxID=2320716 RepID=A0AAP0BCA9_9ASPA